MSAQVNHSYHTERKGVTALAVMIAEMGHIWRETNTGDIGIDGQIEFVSVDGQARGPIIAVQIKSGKSYIIQDDLNNIVYYPNVQHSAYWENYPLPVILIIYNPEDNTLYWEDVRQALRAKDKKNKILIPKSNKIENENRNDIFKNCYNSDFQYTENVKEIVYEMSLKRTNNAGFLITWAEMFCYGLTDICQELYYGIDLFMTIARTRVTGGLGIGLGSIEYDFMFDFIKYLVSQNLVHIDFSNVNRVWETNHMLPTFVAPLTRRGKQLVIAFHEIEKDLIRKNIIKQREGLHVAQEGFYSMDTISFVQRIPLIKDFIDTIRKDKIKP